MKFERINKNKLKVIYTVQDITNHNINVDTLTQNTKEAQKLILHMLESAKDKYGIDFNDYQLMVEAKPRPNKEFEIIISKVDLEENQSPLLPDEPKRKLKLKEETPKIDSDTTKNLILKLESFEECIVFAKMLKTYNPVKSKLYKSNNTYYLSLKPKDNQNLDSLSKLSSDYGVIVLNPYVFEGYLNEHANLLIKLKAIETLNKQFPEE